MKQHKIIFARLLLFSSLLTLFFSCQAPENYIGKHVHSNKIEIVSIDKVQGIVPSIQNFNKNYHFLSKSNLPDNSTSIENLNLDLKNILVYTRKNNGYTSY